MSDATPSASSVFNREFLAIRSRLIDLAATFDRIERTGQLPVGDPRWTQIRRSLEILLADAPQRAEQIQLEFSLKD